MRASHLDRRGPIHLLGLGCLIGLRAEIGCCGTALREVSGEDGLDKGAEDYLSTAAGLVSQTGSPTWNQKTYPVIGRAIHNTRQNLKV